MARKERLTKAEKAALCQAAGEILAGDGKEWTVAAWKALQAGQDKLAAKEEE